MAVNRGRYRGYTEAHRKAHDKYMEQFVEVKVRMTPEEREKIKEYCAARRISVSSFINEAIRMAMGVENASTPPVDGDLGVNH